MAVKKTSSSTKKTSSVKKAAPADKEVKKATKPSNKPLEKGIKEKGKVSTKSPSSSSLAKLWDNEADASKASNQLSEGEHTVRLNSLTLKEDKKKGAAVFLEVEAIDGEEEGRKGRQMYKLTDEDGEKCPGMDYLARDLAILGYENVVGDELLQTLNEVTENQPMIIVRVRAGNSGFTNVFIQGLAEDGELGGDGGGAEEEIEVGSNVTFESEGETYHAEVLKITGNTARVKSTDGEKYDVDLSDLSLDTGEGDGGSAEIEVGSTVSFDDEGTTRTGEVIKLTGDKAVVKDMEGDKYSVDLSDLTLDDGTGGEEQAGEIEVGSRVSFDDEGTERQGEVVKMSDDSATVKDDDGDKYKVDLSDLTLVTD